MPAKIIGVISIKGGVGKTTTVSNLGAVLSNEFNQKVLLVDANFSAPNLGLHLGIINPKVTIHDVLMDNASVSEAIYEHEDFGFHIMPANLLYRKINPYKLKEKLMKLRNDYDVILIDSSPNLNDEILSTILASDELLVVTTPDYPTLSATMHAVKVAKRKNTAITGLIINNVRGKKYELSIEDIEDATDTPVIALLPDDIKILEALSHTTPAVLHTPLSDAAIEYKKLGACLIGQTFKDPRLKSKIKKIFNRKLRKDEVNRLVLKSKRID